MSNQSKTAITAAKNRKIWGRFATLRFIQRNQVSPALYRLACQLEATI